MSVHEAITHHTRKMHAHLETFQLLDAQREQAIDEALTLCKSGKPFTVEPINRITAAINEHAKQGISPTRPYVTESMVQDFAARSSH